MSQIRLGQFCDNPAFLTLSISVDESERTGVRGVARDERNPRNGEVVQHGLNNTDDSLLGRIHIL